MAKTHKTIITVVVLVLVAVIAWLNFGGRKADVDTQKPITLGFIGPLTGNGAVWGLVEKNVIDIAIDEINRAGGIRGRSVRVIYEDGMCRGKEATTAAQKLITIDKVKILMPSCSTEVLAVAPLAEQNKVLLFTAYATNPAIADAGDYVFSNSYSDEDVAQLAAGVISKKFKHVGIITELSDYSVGLKNAFLKYAKQNGVMVFDESYSQDAKDVRAQVAKILYQKPGAIFVNPNTPATGVATLKQLRELGFRGQIYGNYFGGTKDAMEAKEAEEMIFFADPTVEESPIKGTLFETYKKRYGAYPDLEYPATARYDVVYILKQAIEKVGDDPTAIKDYLHQMGNFTGALGTYHFNEKNGVAGILPAIKQIKGGRAVKFLEN